MKLKNYMKEGHKFPLFGIGPYLIYGIGLLTAVCIVLSVYVFEIGNMDGPWKWIFRIGGGALVVYGLIIWFVGALKSDLYGEEYEVYKRRVNRFIPWKRRYL